MLRRALPSFWIIIALLFAIRLVNYLDRQPLSVLKTTLKAAFDFSDVDYSNIILAFMLPYIIMYAFSGWIIERLGTRLSMAMFATLWSIAGILSGLAQNFGQLVASRILLGAAEPAVFPLSQRVVLNWVPERNRAFALSILSPSGSMGAVLAPPLVAGLALAFSWRAGFIVPGVIGLILAALWWRLDRLPVASVRHAEAAPPPKVTELFRIRAFWGIITARMVSDPVWFFFLFWMPGYLQDGLGLSLGQVGLVAGIPYLAALLVCPIVGRFVDLRSAKGHDSVNVQLWVFTAVAALMPLGALIPSMSDVAIAITLITVVTAGAQLWFAGTGVVLAGRLPHSLNATAAGFIGAVGATSGLLINLIAGSVIEQFGYIAVFVGLATLHPLATLILWKTLPRRIEPRADFA